MTKDELWLNLPQTVVLEATRDIERTLALTDDDPNLLILKANRLIARRTVILPDADADEGQQRSAIRKWREESNTPRIDNYYLEIQRRVHRRLNAGVTTKASRTPGGPSDTVDPAELTRVELRGVDAIDKRTQTTSLYNLRINGSEYVESLAAAAIGVAGAASSRTPTEIHEHSSQVLERWDCTGDPLPTLIEWARSRWGDDLQKLPSRPELLRIFREQFGPIPGINEKTMREVRRQLAPEKARRGGAPTHRR